MLQLRPATGTAGPSPNQIPPTGRRVAPRPRLISLLEAAIKASRVVVVGAEAGAGKTTLVASWAAQASSRTVVSWRSLTGDGDVPDVLDAVLFDEPGLLTGVNRLRAIGPDDQGGPTHRIGQLDRVVVLDGFPVVVDDDIHDALDRFLQNTGPHVGLVLIATGSPQLDVQELGIGAGCRFIGSEDLAMNQTEIAAVLARHGVKPSPVAVGDIWRCTAGWTRAVRSAACLSTQALSASDILRELGRTCADYLEHSVLRGLTADERELLGTTSMLDHVGGDIAGALTGGGWLSSTADSRSRGFVHTHADGSFTVHPLLRRHLLDRLRRDHPAERAATRRVIELLAEHHGLEEAVDVAATESDWPWLAGALIDSLHVPRFLVGGRDPRLDSPKVLDGLGKEAPILLAAAALERSWPELAERVLAPAGPAPHRAPESPAVQLSDALVEMALARWHGDVERGLLQHTCAAAAVPQLSVSQRTSAPELVPLLQAHLGFFERCGGSRDRARAALERGARSLRTRTGPRLEPGAQAAAADCLGQLAWLQACDGELTSALHHAAEVLTAPAVPGGQVGSCYAQLANVWCQLSRGENHRATELFHAFVTRQQPAEEAVLPEIAAITSLTAARLAAAGDPVPGTCETALLGSSPSLAPSSPLRLQLEHQLRMIRAECELDGDAPSAALALLCDSTTRSADVHVLRARAWIQLGDLGSVAASLRVRPVETVSLRTRVQLELVEGWLARAHGDRAHERTLIDRALRTAGQEQLRGPISWAKPWLHDMITSDAELLRRHGQFLASVRGAQSEAPGRTTSSCPVTTPVTPLTQRELEILQRLGALSTNEEIGADLFLSTNTVKTHLKSLYRKLDVTRRSDAFRRGRALGLC